MQEPRSVSLVGHTSLTDSLRLSIMPSFFAAGCCATVPLMIIFGFAMGDVTLSDYRWWFFGLGVVFLFTSLGIYFYRRGVVSYEVYKQHRKKILFTTLYTVVLTAIIYTMLVVHVTPFLYSQIQQECYDCGIISL